MTTNTLQEHFDAIANYQVFVQKLKDRGYEEIRSPNLKKCIRCGSLVLHNSLNVHDEFHQQVNAENEKNNNFGVYSQLYQEFIRE